MTSESKPCNSLGKSFPGRHGVFQKQKGDLYEQRGEQWERRSERSPEAKWVMWWAEVGVWTFF